MAFIASGKAHHMLEHLLAVCCTQASSYLSLQENTTWRSPFRYGFVESINPVSPKGNRFEQMFNPTGALKYL